MEKVPLHKSRDKYSVHVHDTVYVMITSLMVVKYSVSQYFYKHQFLSMSSTQDSLPVKKGAAPCKKTRVEKAVVKPRL